MYFSEPDLYIYAWYLVAPVIGDQVAVIEPLSFSFSFKFNCSICLSFFFFSQPAVNYKKESKGEM